MPAPRRATSTGKPKLSHLLESRLSVAAADLGMSPTDALGDAATRWIKWAEQEGPRRKLKAAQAAFDAGRSDVSPDPVAYGLAPDALLPKLKP